MTRSGSGWRPAQNPAVRMSGEVCGNALGDEYNTAGVLPAQPVKIMTANAYIEGYREDIKFYCKEVTGRNNRILEKKNNLTIY